MMSPTRAVCSEPSPSITSTPPSPGSERTDFSSALSWKHLHRGDRPGELRPAAELAQLQIAAADVGADLVDEVGGGARFDGHRSMLATSQGQAISVVAVPTRDEHNRMASTPAAIAAASGSRDCSGPTSGTVAGAGRRVDRRGDGRLRLRRCLFGRIRDVAVAVGVGQLRCDRSAQPWAVPSSARPSWRPSWRARLSWRPSRESSWPAFLAGAFFLRRRGRRCSGGAVAGTPARGASAAGGGGAGGGTSGFSSGRSCWSAIRLLLCSVSSSIIQP